MLPTQAYEFDAIVGSTQSGAIQRYMSVNKGSGVTGHCIRGPTKRGRRVWNLWVLISKALQSNMKMATAAFGCASLGWEKREITLCTFARRDDGRDKMW